MRLDFDIPAEEKAFLAKREKVVAHALEKILNLQTPLDPSQVEDKILPCLAKVFTPLYCSTFCIVPTGTEN